MLVISLVVSSILALVAVCAVRYSRWALTWYLSAYVVLAFVQAFLFLFYPVMLQGLILLPAVAICSRSPKQRRAMIPATAALTAIAYAIVVSVAYADVAAVRRQFPLESIESRLPVPPTNPATSLPKATIDKVSDLEDFVELIREPGRHRIVRRRRRTK